MMNLNTPPNITLHIHLVICCAEINYETTYEERNLFVLFFVGRNLKFEYLYME